LTLAGGGGLHHSPGKERLDVGAISRILANRAGSPYWPPTRVVRRFGQ
jgi:hypothetical protein